MKTENEPDYLDMARQKALDTPIISFYNNKSVFITGGTGFLGGVLVEKLLFSCPKLKNIYLLIRENKKGNHEQRFQDFLNSQLFERIDETNDGKIKQKIIPVFGDLTQKQLGINEIQLEKIKDEVSVVFHSAASVKFDNDLVKSIKINTNGTAEVVKFSKGIKRLSAFVYVSTAYSNSDRTFIYETIYNKNVDLKHINHLVDELKLNDNLLKGLLEGKANIYTFSKAIAEEHVANEMKNIPTAIVRPSIIISSAKEPLPGWANGWNGANSLAASICRGQLRTMREVSGVIFDAIPVDYVSNLLIASAWDVHANREEMENKTCKVYNCTSSLRNPIKFSDFYSTCCRYGKKYFPGGLVPQTLFVQEYMIIEYLFWFLIELIPAFLIDMFMLLTGKKPRKITTQFNLWSLKSVLQFFSMNHFVFNDYNVKELYEKLDIKDKEIFDFNVKHITWESVVEDFVLGLQKYLIKETK